uniref:RING-type E3 ubiquitin transferase n=1 Tax=Kalanchoe fedtschenkoi TaxID=63787 RepID=A0A7N0UN01_KALFE
MGQGLSCASDRETRLVIPVRSGDTETVRSFLERDGDDSLLKLTTGYDRQSALHIAAVSGWIEILCLLLDRSMNPDVLNRHKQTPLMLAVIHGKIACVQKLLQAGANVLMFDSINGRTCLHYAAFHGHSDCLQAIISAARSSPIAASWGFTRFVNVRDSKGATPLHLASFQRRSNAVQILLDNGALVCTSTGRYGFPGSTPLHLAARAGSLDCIRKLLSWGADRMQRDSSGRIPYVVALKHKHPMCAALLNPAAAEPLVWPSPLKFISELNQDTKILLERALMDANREREKNILKGTAHISSSPSQFDVELDDNSSEISESELCCICFDQVCTIEVQDCGHQMCAQCTLALCCHNKPNPTTMCPVAPVCPFCRSRIAHLAVAKIKTYRAEEPDYVLDASPSSRLSKLRKSFNFSEGSSSFKGLSAFGIIGGGRGSGRIAAESDEKP